MASYRFVQVTPTQTAVVRDGHAIGFMEDNRAVPNYSPRIHHGLHAAGVTLWAHEGDCPLVATVRTLIALERHYGHSIERAMRD